MHPMEALQQNPFVLAPMAGITDHAFRTFMRALDASVVITELISSHGIEYRSERTLQLMSFDESQRPVGIQLFGEDPEMLGRAAQLVQEKGADFVDLNFGCPVPKVVKKGAGSAMLKDLPALKTVLSAVKKAVDIPVTIKIRTGWDAGLRNAIEVCKIAEGEGITWVAIHGRTRAQGYSGWSDWDYITEVKSKAQIPIIGNGDLHSAARAVERLKQSGCDGVMIGRGCLKNPTIFRQALHQWKNPGAETLKELCYLEVLSGLRQSLETFAQPHLVGIQMKKFAAWFSSGYPGASQFRKKIFQSKSHEETMEMAFQFFETVSVNAQQDTSHEEFLMGGHG
ncbi:MAG: tRNA dihydrouridine synthase DusB [Bdellovibrionota bacterium]